VASTTGRKILINRRDDESGSYAVQFAAAGATSLSTHDQIANVFSRNPRPRHCYKFGSARGEAFTIWAEVNGVTLAA
jgi:hypothetical protein